MEKTYDINEHITDKRRIKPEDVGLDLTIGADHPARLLHLEQLQNEAQTPSTETEPIAPLTPAEATRLLDFSDTLRGKQAETAKEYETRNPHGAASLIELSETHGKTAVLDTLQSLQSSLNWRMEKLGLHMSQRTKSTATFMWDVVIHHQGELKGRKATKTFTPGDAVADGDKAEQIIEEIINQRLGREYSLSRNDNKADLLSPERNEKINALLTVNETKPNWQKDGGYVRIGEILTAQADAIDLNKEADPITPEADPIAPVVDKADMLTPIEPIDTVEKSAEKRNKLSLKNLGTAALLNFKVAREIGFKRFVKESLNPNPSARYDKIVTKVGDKLIEKQRSINNKIEANRDKEPLKSRISTRYNETIKNIGDKLVAKQRELNEKRQVALDRKTARKVAYDRLVAQKTAQMRADIALRQQAAIREAVRKHALENKHAL